MSDRCFFDTNILFYAYDSSDSVKQAAAQALLQNAANSGTGVVSTQVLGEFFHATVIRKRVLTADEAELAIDAISALEVVDVDLASVRVAIGYHRQFQLRYWDALILATAKWSGCSKLLSEDLNDGQDYDGDLARNPFKVGAQSGGA